MDWPEGGRLSRIGELYRDLFALMRETPALHNAAWSARMVRVVTDGLAHVSSSVREDRQSEVLFDLSAQPREVTLTGGPFAWSHRQPLGGEPVRLAPGAGVELEPWGWRVLAATADTQTADPGRGRTRGGWALGGRERTPRRRPVVEAVQ